MIDKGRYVINVSYVYAVVQDFDVEDGGSRVKLNIGDMGLEFVKVRRSDVSVVSSFNEDEKWIRLKDGTKIDYRYFENGARVVTLLHNGVASVRRFKRDCDVYSSGKNRPVGFMYGNYFLVIAPYVSVEEEVEVVPIASSEEIDF